MIMITLSSLMRLHGCSSKDHARKFSYALRGEDADEHRCVHSDNRISAIAAMTSGMLAVELKTGSVNGDDFLIMYVAV